MAQLVKQCTVNGNQRILRKEPESSICPFFSLRKWDLGHWDFESQTNKNGKGDGFGQGNGFYNQSPSTLLFLFLLLLLLLLLLFLLSPLFRTLL